MSNSVREALMEEQGRLKERVAALHQESSAIYGTIAMNWLFGWGLAALAVAAILGTNDMGRTGGALAAISSVGLLIWGVDRKRRMERARNEARRGEERLKQIAERLRSSQA